MDGAADHPGLVQCRSGPPLEGAQSSTKDCLAALFNDSLAVLCNTWLLWVQGISAIGQGVMPAAKLLLNISEQAIPGWPGALGQWCRVACFAMQSQ